MAFAEARKKAGLTLGEAAKKLKVTTSAICQWESGNTFPEARRLAEIAKVYNTTVDELLGGEKIENQV